MNEKVLPKKISRIYLAGPFFNETEIKNIEYVEKLLAKKGLSFFSPMRAEFKGFEIGTPDWANAVFKADCEQIRASDAVLALYYGSNGDTGTAWECGYAYSICKPVILVHVKREGDANIMMHCSSYTNIFLEDLESLDFENIPVIEYKGKMF